MKRISTVLIMLGALTMGFLIYARSQTPRPGVQPLRPGLTRDSTVVIYEATNFGGRSLPLGIGNHELSADFNNIASSIKVPAGLGAILYELADDGGGYGMSVDLLEDQPDLSKFNLNHKVSYISVFSTNRQGFFWARNSMQNGQFVRGHWERARASGNPVNTVAVVSPPLPAPANNTFYVRSYGGKCLTYGAPRTLIETTVARSYPVFISDCNRTAVQQIRVEELTDTPGHLVILRAGSEVIGKKLNPVLTTQVSSAALSLSSTADQTPLEVQPYTGSAGQIFALDGDSMILASDRNLVIEVQNNRGKNQTPLVLGRRDLDDSEFWTFTATNGSDGRPTSGFVRVSENLLDQVSGGTQAKRDFLNAVQSARRGTVIELDPNVSLNLTGMPPLEIKAGVTIRGDRRGTRPGPLLVNKHAVPGNRDFRDFDGGMLFITGDHVRITGLRMQGPSRDIHESLPYANAIAAPDQFISIIDHNEMFDWTAAAVYVPGEKAGEGVRDHRDPSSRPQNVRVVRNFIHHNHMWGNGYGVVTYSGYPAIEGNTFLSNRHAIAASNNAFTGYTASFNLVLSASPDYASLGFSRTPDFDMHGTLHEGCQYCGGAAGWYARIARNTFLGTNRANFTLRGTPGYLAEFRGNISLQSPGDALLIRGNDPLKKLVTDDNQFNASDPTKRTGVGDFDGDGKEDLFLATGAAWYYAPAGSAEWRFLNAQTEKIDSLQFGDFDGDGRTDVFTQHGRDRVVSWGGASKWEKIN